MAAPSSVVKPTWPNPAPRVTAMVFGRLQPRTLETSTNGNQCVGIAAWKKATVNPVAAMVARTAEFMRRFWVSVADAQRRTGTLNHPIHNSNHFCSP